MALVFFGSPTWQLIAQSDFMTKMIVLALGLLSVLCVAVIIAKWLQFAAIKKLSIKHHAGLINARNTTELHSAGKNAGGWEAELALMMLSQARALEKDHLTEDDLEHLSMVGERFIGTNVADMESYLPTLGISGSVSPLIGLFGTVWGLIHAFVSISHEKSADIAVVAPGIAEALITTLAGLIVAIPALIFFHYFSNELRKIEQRMLQVLDHSLAIIKRS
jgi:biopolymer transport protein TolQ